MNTISRILALVCASAICMLLSAQVFEKTEIKDGGVVRVYPQTVVGSIKPMNGVNNMTIGSKYGWFKDLKISYGRTHDASLNVSLGGPHLVDIHCIFPDFDKDVNDPKAYDFKMTDLYLQKMVDAGVKPFYRLGSSIEHQAKKYGVLPPKNFQKWAEICEHVIRHYNEGWADGKHLGIEYWEIWNEADLDSAEHWKNNPRTWGAPYEKFLELYEVAAKHLKKKFPHLKIGGPAAARPRQYADGFLKYMKAHNAPVDFYSWHNYNVDPKVPAEICSFVRKRLDMYGFSKTESIFNEWNYVNSWKEDYPYSGVARLTEKGGAYVASVMCNCQHRPVDILMYYDMRPGTPYNSAFDPYSDEPLTAYYAFYAWSKMMGADEVKLEGLAEDCSGVASRDSEGNVNVLLSRFNQDNNVVDKEIIEVSVEGYDMSKAVLHLTDIYHRYTEVATHTTSEGKLRMRLMPNAFVMIQLKKVA